MSDLNPTHGPRALPVSAATALLAFAVVLVSGLTPPPAHALMMPVTHKTAPPTCALITKATIWQPDGAKSGALRIDDGTIVATTRPAGKCVVRKIQGPSLVVTPGFVETVSSIGLVEVWLEGPSNDAAAVGNKAGPVPIRANFRAFDAYNPRSTLIPVTRAEGVTHILTSPTGGIISGQAGFMRLRGRLQTDAAVSPSAAMVARLGATSGSRAFRLQTLRSTLQEARTFLGGKAKGKGLSAPVGTIGPHGTPQAYYQHLAALGPVLTAAVPLVVYADRASEIESLIRLKTHFGIRLVVAGAAEGWIVAKELAAAKVPVIVDPLRYRPGSFDQIHARMDNPARLLKAGVDVIVSSFATHDARRLRQVAGNAVRGGLTRDQALKAITWTPQRVFGQPPSKITVGAKANLAIWDGDPLEPRTSLLYLWIDGVEVSTDTRQKQLMRRYLNAAAPAR